MKRRPVSRDTEGGGMKDICRDEAMRRLTLDKDVRYYSLNRAFENSDLYVSSGYLAMPLYKGIL